MLNHTHSGYLVVNETLGSDLFHIYWEATEPTMPLKHRPIILWLNGGPGCASLFGSLYLGGPWRVTEDLELVPNPGAWNRRFGMLFIDQPIGTGYSRAGHDTIPHNEILLGYHLYLAIQYFYTIHPEYQKRPFFVTGESYAGKYVPSLTHFIIQADAKAQGKEHELRKTRRMPDNTPAPVFPLGGMAIGNGWVDAAAQLKVQGDVSWAFGLIDVVQRRVVESMVDETLEHMKNLEWRKARKASDAVMAYITNVSATATMEDMRRNKAYDADARTDQFFNLPEVKRDIHADPKITWAACSDIVDDIMGHDVMKSVKKLIPDIIHRYPVLIYLGQFDAECGVAANDAWVHSLPWTGHAAFAQVERKLWMVNDTVAGFKRHHANLTELVVRNAGHMVPHDKPLESQIMIEDWIFGVLNPS
eukprot:jgi/Chrzof1/12560/UNPLg00512.t1